MSSPSPQLQRFHSCHVNQVATCTAAVCCTTHTYWCGSFHPQPHKESTIISRRKENNKCILTLLVLQGCFCWMWLTTHLPSRKSLWTCSVFLFLYNFSFPQQLTWIERLSGRRKTNQKKKKTCVGGQMSKSASSPYDALKATSSVSVSISLCALIALSRSLRMHQRWSFCSPRQI